MGVRRFVRCVLGLAFVVACGPAVGERPRPSSIARTTPQHVETAMPAPSVEPPPASTPTVTPPVAPAAPPVQPTLIVGMRSRIARGDDYFPDLDNGCTDAHGYITTPLWDEARLMMILPSRLAERRVKVLARQAAQALQHNQYAALAQQVDPGRGLCMRPAKGGTCVHLTQADVVDCRKFHHDDWDIDSGADGPFPGTCHDMVESVFAALDFTKPTSTSYSCFSGLRGNNGSSIIQPDSRPPPMQSSWSCPRTRISGARCVWAT